MRASGVIFMDLTAAFPAGGSVRLLRRLLSRP